MFILCLVHVQPLPNRQGTGVPSLSSKADCQKLQLFKVPLEAGHREEVSYYKPPLGLKTQQPPLAIEKCVFPDQLVGWLVFIMGVATLKDHIVFIFHRCSKKHCKKWTAQVLFYNLKCFILVKIKVHLANLVN